jgi:hypothetical protein
LKFFPAEVTVQVGSTVVWQNLSDLQHDAKADGGAFDSKLLNKGEKFEFKFSAPGDYSYFCTPHKDAGMKGVIHVAGGATPATVATTPTTQGGSTGTTATTAAPGATTTTTAKAAGVSSTTTTTAAAAANGATTTTLASSAPAASASATAGETAATTASGSEEAGADHNAEGTHKKKNKEKNSPIGIAFASVSTLLLATIAGKLLASKP